MDERDEKINDGVIFEAWVNQKGNLHHSNEKPKIVAGYMASGCYALR